MTAQLSKQKKVITGNAAAAYGALLCRPDVVAVYPITPQSEVIEQLAKFHADEWLMIDPTLRSLETLSQWQTVEQALAGVKQGDHLMPLTPELNRQGMQKLR